MLPTASFLLAGTALGYLVGLRSRRVLHAIDAEHERQLVESYAAGQLDGRAASSRRFRVLEDRSASFARVAAAADRWAAGLGGRSEVVRLIAAHEREFGSLATRRTLDGQRERGA